MTGDISEKIIEGGFFCINGDPLQHFTGTDLCYVLKPRTNAEKTRRCITHI